MNSNKHISITVIKRLPRYYRYLGELLDNDINRISSMELSRKMNITASQIRQDLNNFGCFGQQGYGYNVENLFNEIGKILGLSRNYRMIIIGAGNIGQALARYTPFKKRGYQIAAIFDNNLNMIGKTVGDLQIQDIAALETFLAHNKVDIAVLTLPGKEVADMARHVVSLGIKGIWNFAPVDLHMPDYVQVENVHLTDSLMTLTYKLCNNVPPELNESN